jgi:hypothetical protein
MTRGAPDRIIIDCTECHFSETESTDGDRLPADVLQKHGRETGHILSLSPAHED